VGPFPYHFVDGSITIRERINQNKLSASLKNKFFKNIGFSVFAPLEANTAKFKENDKVTVSYCAGINYTFGKHLTLQAEFAKTRKVYVTDRKGYNPAAGSPFIPIDTLKVNADCKVWDIPVNLRYSFSGNIKNSFLSYQASTKLFTLPASSTVSSAILFEMPTSLSYHDTIFTSLSMERVNVPSTIEE